MHLLRIFLVFFFLQARSIMHFAANPIDLPEYGVSTSARMVSRPMTMSKGKRCSIKLIDRCFRLEMILFLKLCQVLNEFLN